MSALYSNMENQFKSTQMQVCTVNVILIIFNGINGKFSNSSYLFERGLDLACSQHFMDNLGNDNLEMDTALNEKNEKKKCFNLCDFQNEVIELSSSDYPSKNTFDSRNDLCLIILKLHRICQNKQKFEIFENFYKIKRD